jgi:hypothetical protein
MEELLNNNEKNNLYLSNNIEQEKLEKEQNSFLQTNLGRAINGGIDLGLRVLLPNFIEDEVISIKDSLITEGFSAAISTAIEEATNLGKSAMGLITGTFENISQVNKAIKKGGLIDTISDILDTGISWAQKHGYIEKGTAKTIKKRKKSCNG